MSGFEWVTWPTRDHMWLVFSPERMPSVMTGSTFSRCTFAFIKTQWSTNTHTRNTFSSINTCQNSSVFTQYHQHSAQILCHKETKEERYASLEGKGGEGFRCCRLIYGQCWWSLLVAQLCVVFPANPACVPLTNTPFRNFEALRKPNPRVRSLYKGVSVPDDTCLIVYQLLILFHNFNLKIQYWKGLPNPHIYCLNQLSHIHASTS
jgi:hypothetical protein